MWIKTKTKLPAFNCNIGTAEPIREKNERNGNNHVNNNQNIHPCSSEGRGMHSLWLYGDFSLQKACGNALRVGMGISPSSGTGQFTFIWLVLRLELSYSARKCSRVIPTGAFRRDSFLGLFKANAVSYWTYENQIVLHWLLWRQKQKAFSKVSNTDGLRNLSVGNEPETTALCQ